MCHSFQWMWRTEHFLLFIFPTKGQLGLEKEKETHKGELKRWKQMRERKNFQIGKQRNPWYRLRAESWKQIAWKQGLGWWNQGPRKAPFWMPGWRLRWKQKDGFIWFLLLPCNPLSTPSPAQQRTGARHVERASHAGFQLRTTRNRDEHRWAASQLITDLAIAHELKAERHYVFEGKKKLKAYINLFQDTRGIEKILRTFTEEENRIHTEDREVEF